MPPDGTIDSDVDLHDASERDETRVAEWDLLAVIALGGVIGAEARYGLAELLPHPTTAWPWSTLTTNVLGCLLIGVLMTVLECTTPHRLARPFLGVGILGGFTTFSTFGVDVQRLLVAHRPFVALGYAAVTLVVCLVAVAVAGPPTRALLDRRGGAG